jgi:hypothetical protein
MFLAMDEKKGKIELKLQSADSQEMATPKDL